MLNQKDELRKIQSLKGLEEKSKIDLQMRIWENAEEMSWSNMKIIEKEALDKQLVQHEEVKKIDWDMKNIEQRWQWDIFDSQQEEFEIAW